MIPYNYTIQQYRAISICSRIAALRLQWEASDETSKLIDAKWTRLELNALKEQLNEIDLTTDFKKICKHESCLEYLNSQIEIISLKYIRNGK
jgi:hypothetical protein